MSFCLKLLMTPLLTSLRKQRRRGSFFCHCCFQTETESIYTHFVSQNIHAWYSVIHVSLSQRLPKRIDTSLVKDIWQNISVGQPWIIFLFVSKRNLISLISANRIKRLQDNHFQFCMLYLKFGQDLVFSRSSVCVKIYPDALTFVASRQDYLCSSLGVSTFIEENLPQRTWKIEWSLV